MSLLGGGGGGLPIKGDQARAIAAFRRDWTLGASATPTEIATTSAGGGTVSRGRVFHTLSTDGTADAHAYLGASGGAVRAEVGLYIGLFHWASDSQAIADLAEAFEIGFISPGTEDSDDLAAFRPAVGDETQGNIRVDSSGADSDGTFSYPALKNEAHPYAIVIDYDLGETRFYVDRHWAVDGPDATIAATPDQVQEPGFQILSNGNDADEGIRCHAIGIRYVP